MKCTKCSQRKGKRPCPALNASICPQCCGEKRVLEIPCTADCQFLKAGQGYQWTKKYIAMLEAEENPRRKRRLYHTVQELFPVLGEIERVIVEYALPLTSIKDQDVLEAMDLLIEAYDTESKGVIYEPSATNPLAHSLSKQIRSNLEKRRQEWAEQEIKLTAEQFRDCAEALKAEITFHLRSSTKSNDYLTFASRNHPDLSQKKGRGGLIVPA